MNPLIAIAMAVVIAIIFALGAITAVSGRRLFRAVDPLPDVRRRVQLQGVVSMLLALALGCLMIAIATSRGARLAGIIGALVFGIGSAVIQVLNLPRQFQPTHH